jgi:hypothetical protein
MSCCGKKGLARIAHGALGISKAMVHADRAAPATIQHRRATCVVCPHSDAGKGGRGLGRCDLCGCWLRFKIVLQGERCPESKW